MGSFSALLVSTPPGYYRSAHGRVQRPDREARVLRGATQHVQGYQEEGEEQGEHDGDHTSNEHDHDLSDNHGLSVL